MSDDTAPLPDRVEGAPHPRETPRLIGQGAAERAFLDAYNAGRLHHGWLITGPRGVGKATLAWSIARFLLEIWLGYYPAAHGEPIPIAIFSVSCVQVGALTLFIWNLWPRIRG